MAVHFDEKVEQTFLELLYTHELERRDAERKLIRAREEVEEKEQAIIHARFMIDDYRKQCGLPVQIAHRHPMLNDEYANLGPTELVDCWADQHDGEVIVKELTHVGLAVGTFTKYQNGASAIYSVLKRKPYKKLSPGHFKKNQTQTSMLIQNGDSENIPLPASSFEPIVVAAP